MGAFKTVAALIFCSLVAGGAGGAAGATMLTIWPTVMAIGTDGVPLTNQLIAVLGAMGAGLVLGLLGGVVVGAIIGFIPSFIVGLALTALSRWRPFQSLALWALTGALAGFVMSSLFNWDPLFNSTPSWVFGGAAAMMAYWALGVRLFRLTLLPASATQA